jgi:site-specific DNA recombinase
MPHASLYLRISVASDSSDSIERQERDLRQLAATEGFDVVAVHVDEGVSGAATHRPAFRAWLDDASSGRADVLLAWRFDRISREGLPAVARLLEVLKESGARVMTHGDRVDSTSQSFRLTAAVMSEVAYAEREAIRARVTSRQAADRRRGAWTKERPFGYEVADGRLVQHVTEAEIVRDIVKRFLAGESLRGLAFHLDGLGVPTPRAAKGRRVNDGARWGLTSVRSILANPVLAGWWPHRVGGVIRPARGDDGELVIVTDEPILSPGEWAAVQSKLDSRSVMGPKGRRRPTVGAPLAHPLSGLMRCGRCGGPLVFQSKRGGRHDTFRCARRTQQPAACPGFHVRASVVEDVVASRVVGRVAALEPGSPELEAIAARWLRAQDPADDAERRAAAAAVADLEAAVADLEAARYERGEFPGADGAARWQRLYDRALLRLTAARDALDTFALPMDVGGLLDPALLADALSGDAASRGALYRLVFDRVTVTPPDGVVIAWAGDAG